MPRNPKQDANLKPIQKGQLSHEEAKKRGQAGAKKSAEVRRAKRDARESMRYLLGLKPTKEVIEQIQRVSNAKVEDGLTNLEALNVRMLSLALGGNQEAYNKVLKIAGYEPEEIRAERESINADRRREVELNLKQETLVSRNVADANISMGFTNEEGGNDVFIYLPAIDGEDENESGNADSSAEQENAEKDGKEK